MSGLDTMEWEEQPKGVVSMEILKGSTVKRDLLFKPAQKKSLPGQNNHGQILVEYILLMVVAISVALLITSFMVSRNFEQPGFLIAKWYAIITEIGNDFADGSAP